MADSNAALAEQLAPSARMVSTRMGAAVCIGIAVAAGAFAMYEHRSGKGDDSMVMMAGAVAVAALMGGLYFGYHSYLQTMQYKRDRFRVLASIAQTDPAEAKMLGRYSSTNQRTDAWAPTSSGSSSSSNNGFMDTILKEAASKL